jgi:hypothetical protein
MLRVLSLEIVLRHSVAYEIDVVKRRIGAQGRSI